MKKEMVLVGMSLKHAQWLGMAASVAGGCVAVSEAASDAVAALGWSGPQMIGLVPAGWLPSPDYTPLTATQIVKIKAVLNRNFSGWSGAARANDDYAATRKMLQISGEGE